ncbi:MAG TPA: 50S ribosomal protein L17 [Melioribacteraceae bacterium]|nr:50S ribosomal protein L17 [Melioribacteraceae bacterium]
MRHRVKGNKLGRTYSHRLATLKSLATSLILHKKIKTTVAKAKEAKVFIEPLITKAKVDTVANRRLIARFINDKDAVKMLFTEIREKVLERNGGYLRVVKLGNRRGDAADMAILEFVDYNIVEKADKKTVEKKESVKTAAVEDAKVVEEVKNEVVTEVKTEETTKVEDNEPEVKSEDTTEKKEKE